jgi:hypothetical protein
VSAFFRNFPQISYNGKTTRNIILRSGIAKGVVEKYGVFYPYTVRMNDRIDTIAFNYYGDSNYFWLICLANDIMDPYNDWPLDDQNFLEYIISKYGSYEYAQSTVHHWKSADVSHWMSPETHAYLDPAEKVGFTVSVSVWDWEHTLNEEKKSIRLLSRKYAPQAMRELQTVFDGDRS